MEGPSTCRLTAPRTRCSPAPRAASAAFPAAGDGLAGQRLPHGAPASAVIVHSVRRQHRPRPCRPPNARRRRGVTCLRPAPPDGAGDAAPRRGDDTHSLGLRATKPQVP